MNEKKPTLTFGPGCFDTFDGTQEELNELIKKTTDMVENGRFGDGVSNVRLVVLDDDEIDEIRNKTSTRH